MYQLKSAIALNNLLVLFFLYLFSCEASAQTAQKNTGDILINKITDYNDKFPVEKLYMQIDKPDYIVNDTIWFKGYIVDPTIAYSSLSSRLYIDILNDSNKVVKSLVVP